MCDLHIVCWLCVGTTGGIVTCVLMYVVRADMLTGCLRYENNVASVCHLCILSHLSRLLLHTRSMIPLYEALIIFYKQTHDDILDSLSLFLSTFYSQITEIKPTDILFN